MIRYSRSFFISLALHTLSFGLLFVLLKDIALKDEKSDERVCLKLQEIQEAKEIVPKIQEPQKTEITPEPKPQKTEPLKQTVQKKVEVLKPKPLEEKILKEETITEVQKIQEESPLKSDFSLQQNHMTQSIEQNIAMPPQENKIKDASQEYIELNTALIAKLIKENLSYPVSARRQGITGVVLIKFNLSSDAKISDVTIKESSSEILSRAAAATIEELSQKLPKPSKDITLIIPIEYKLN